MKDYYRILTVPGNATQAEIRKAYYKLAHQYHPDKSPSKEHHQQFLEINEAYEILGDKQKREVYHYRWVNFHNPPKVKPQPNPAPQPQYSRQQTQQQPYYKAHYQNYSKPTYQEYEPVLRRVCLLVLVFSGLLLLDYLTAIQYPNETIFNFSIQNFRGQQTFWLYTEHTKFRAPVEAYEQLPFWVGQKVDVWKTPLFGQISKIRFQGENITVNGGSIYQRFLFLLLLQTGIAAAGLRKKNSWNNRMNFSVTAGLCALVTALIIYLN